MIERKGFWQSGHKGSLFSSFLYFDMSFMVWVLLGPLAVIIAGEFELNAAEKANLVALPTLGGSVLRLVLGYLTDKIGPKLTGQIGLGITLVPLWWGWQFADTIGEMYAIALLLGIAGASFAAALPLASRWYPPQYQWLAMGIAGAGNSGTIFATLFANRIAQYYGDWHVVFGIAMLPIVLTLIVFSILAKDSPNQPAPKKLADYGKVLKQRDAWLFCLLYGVTFGGFVGLSTYLTIFFNTQYGLSPVKAADFTTLCVIGGSFFRPVGGWLADKLGGIRMLMGLYGVVALLMAGISTLPPACGNDDAALHGHDVSGHGQRLGVPARSPALPRGDRDRHRHCRRGRRAWGIFSAQNSRQSEARNRLLYIRIFDLKRHRPFVCGIGGGGPRPMEAHLDRRRRQSDRVPQGRDRGRSPCTVSH